MRADDIDHVKERTWILSWYSGDQLWQLMMLNTRSFCGKLVQFLRHIATMSEDQVKCIRNSRVCCEFSDWVQVAMTACTNPESLVRSAVAADGDYELRAPERNSWS